MSSYSSFLKKTFLFKGLDEDDIVCLLKNVSIEEKSYQRTDVIYSPSDFEKKIGFVYSGKCTVGRQSGGSVVPLNVIKEYDSFGIVTVFSDRDEFPTMVKANIPSTIIFFSAEDIRALVRRDSRIAVNVIKFLTAKINFMNDKVAAFSGGCVEEKLASYLLGLKRKYDSSEFDFNKKKSAEALNCGRASLYRAIASLESGGYVSFENKKIHIIDPEGLERISK
jgi:CRP-like cAMP-binding protein